MAKITKITVGHLEQILKDFKVEGKITDRTEVWLASDEEGNSYSPFIQVGKMLNVGVEDDKSRLTFYPSSTHSERDF
jgi:hypothetical protein